MPNRYLREEIITSRWNRCSWMAQSFYIRLLGLVCDYGRYEADATILCAQAFPTYPHFRTATVRKLLAELVAKELILQYTVEGKPYLQILRWKERVRQRKPKHPGLEADQIDGSYSDHVTPSPKGASEDARHAYKQRTSPNPPLTTARQVAGNGPPPTPDALALKPIHKEQSGFATEKPLTAGPKRLHGIPASVEEVIAYGQSINPRI